MRAVIGIAGVAGLIVVGVILFSLRAESVALGPVDGHGLPGIDLERVTVGEEAPDFSLRALSGDVITLSDYRDEKNVVLVFYRGHW